MTSHSVHVYPFGSGLERLPSVFTCISSASLRHKQLSMQRPGLLPGLLLSERDLSGRVRGRAEE
jgi:hypothetical protein